MKILIVSYPATDVTEIKAMIERFNEFEDFEIEHKTNYALNSYSEAVISETINEYLGVSNLINMVTYFITMRGNILYSNGVFIKTDLEVFLNYSRRKVNSIKDFKYFSESNLFPQKEMTQSLVLEMESPSIKYAGWIIKEYKRSLMGIRTPKNTWTGALDSDIKTLIEYVLRVEIGVNSIKDCTKLSFVNTKRIRNILVSSGRKNLNHLELSRVLYPNIKPWQVHTKFSEEGRRELIRILRDTVYAEYYTGEYDHLMKAEIIKLFGSHKKFKALMEEICNGK